MRRQLLCVTAILTATPAFSQQAWTAACQGGKDAQYSQTMDGKGTLSVANSDGTHTAVPVKQAFYDGDVVCGLTGVDAPSRIGEVCADRKRSAISVLTLQQLKDGNNPETAPVYCSATVTVR